MFPFQNFLQSFDITGKELIDLLAVVQAGGLGFYHTAGLRITVAANGQSNHRFINATWIDGTPI